MRKFLLFAAVALIGLAQTVERGANVATFHSDIDDSDQAYALYVPQGYTSSRAWPLVVSLHGEGSSPQANLQQVFGLGTLPGRPSRAFPDLEYLVASPVARGDIGYDGIGEKDVLAVMAEVKRRFRVDEDRVYLTGISRGGGGALALALRRPDLWAAIAVVCPVVPPGLESLSGNALHLPVRFMQGELDPIVPAAQTRAWHQRFLDAGVRSEYVEYESIRHNAWDIAYKGGTIFQWFGQYQRIEKPSRVQLTADTYLHSSAYWLQFSGLTPGTPASADAEILDGRLAVRTSGLNGFRIDRRRTPAPPTSVSVDGRVIAMSAGTRANSLGFLKENGVWKPARSGPGGLQKGPGAEGPLAAAIAERHFYVYGTEGQPATDELIRRREVAVAAAKWSAGLERPALRFRVVSDVESVDIPLADSSLVLFGTRSSNNRIAAYANRLPLHLSDSAADYGLVYVFPVDGRYVVVSSGLPWWTRADQVRRAGVPSVAPPWKTLQSFGDFILFRGGLDQVLAEGRFDNEWRLPITAAAAMRATGAVEITERP
ncbi:MAG: prolyl oligopeptidase family serine peptidase [Bryobacteraceae bacterium]|nr:prolyl oligopeptidase family serine peptidase [Bryobacteraceae bacterium]